MKRGATRLIVGLILLGSVLPNTLTAGHGYYLLAGGASHERAHAPEGPVRSEAIAASTPACGLLGCPLGAAQAAAEQPPVHTREAADGQGAGNKEHDHAGHMVTVVDPSELRSLEDAFVLNKSAAVLRPLPADILIVAGAYAAPIDPPPRSL
ncbi:MAG: hypothetical protein Q7T33_05120 [Dehalococcoidia bacterium]|nr:hypothetical protein [Dehalococcoidia bacterium]